jgi:hypothetical protein
MPRIHWLSSDLRAVVQLVRRLPPRYKFYNSLWLPFRLTSKTRAKTMGYFAFVGCAYLAWFALLYRLSPFSPTVGFVVAMTAAAPLLVAMALFGREVLSRRFQWGAFVPPGYILPDSSSAA